MFQDTRKSWDSGKDVTITLLSMVIGKDDNGKDVTVNFNDTNGACELTGFSVSNISKLARNSSIKSTDFGKSRLIDIESLKVYYDTQRKQPSARTQELSVLRQYAKDVAKTLSGNGKSIDREKKLAALTLALDAELARLAKLGDNGND